MSNKILKFVFASILCLFAVQILTPINSNAMLVWRWIACAIFIWCIYKGLQEPKYINPYILFSVTLFSLLVYSEKVSSYFLVELDSRTWLLVMINVIAFLMSFTLFYKHSFTIGSCILLRPRSFLPYENEKDYRFLGIGLFLIGKIPEISTLIGISIPFAHFISMCQFLGLAMTYKSGSKKMTYVLSGIYLALALLTTFNKTNLLFLLFCLFICMESGFDTKRQELKIIVIGAIAMLLMVFVAFPLKDFLAYGGKLSSYTISDAYTTSAYFADRINWNGNNLLMLPYMYLSTNWTNLQYVISNTSEHTMGLWLFRPLLSYLQMTDGIQAYSGLVPYRPAFNTYSFIAVEYVDFGMIGSIIPTICLGIYVAYIYKRYTSYPDSFNCACYALVSCAVLEMFFSNHFFNQSYPFTILIVAIACSFIVNKIKIRRKQ